MFEKYHYLVVGIVRKLKRGLPFHADEDDLCADGSIGLLDAIARFDKSKNVAFPSYAGYRIRGQILDGLRKRNWMSCSAQKRITKMHKTIQELGHELNRPPYRHETARRMKVSLKKLAEIEVRAVSQVTPESLQGLSSDVMMDTTPSNIPAPEEGVLFEDLIGDCVTFLTVREQAMWRLRYVEGRKIREIGDIYRISESRTCQLLKRIDHRVRLPA